MNSSLKNSELMAIEAVAEAINAGCIVLIDKKETSNPEFTNLYFLGKVDGIAGASAEVSEAARDFLGWSTSTIARSIQNAKTEIAEKLELGKPFEKLALRCVDTSTPQYKGQDPRVTSNAEPLYNDGKPIYRNFQVVSKAELEGKLPHVILKATTEVVEKEKPAGVPIDQLVNQ